MIDYAALNTAERKTALTALLDLISGDEHRGDAKAVMKYQKCVSVVEFLSLTDTDIDNFTLYKKEGRELVQQLLPVTLLSTIKHLKGFANYLMTKSLATSMDTVTSATFETYVLRQVQNKNEPNYEKLMEAIDKFTLKDFPHFNGDTVNWPGIWCKASQIIKNWGMVKHIDTNATPPTEDNSKSMDVVGQTEHFLDDSICFPLDWRSSICHHQAEHQCP